MGKQFLNPEQVFDPKTFTHTVAVSGGKLVYVSGQVSYDRAGNVVGKGDMRAQCERIFESLGYCLAAAGATFGDIIKVNGYMVNSDPDAVRIYREVRAKFLNPAQLPASTLVGVERLVHPDLLLEVEVIACMDGEPVKKKASVARPKAARKTGRKAKS